MHLENWECQILIDAMLNIKYVSWYIEVKTQMKSKYIQAKQNNKVQNT